MSATYGELRPMQLPGYEILEQIGRGGMGVVYRARQVHLNREVALKMMSAGTHAGPEERARFRMEAQAAARLDHPNIVRVYDFGEHQGLPYFSMELIAGKSLTSRIGGQPWPIAPAISFIHTLALAIHHAHEHQVIHRDLKPSNVLVTQDGTPKITDFGLAKQLDSSIDLTGTGRILGTIQYMAPEQAEGDIHAISPATDVHALGVILYELLTGQPAFSGTTLLEILLHIRSHVPRSPVMIRPEVPAGLEAVCMRCLQKNAVRRFGSARALAEELQGLIDGERDQPLPSPVWPPEPGASAGDRSQWWRF
jgi:serine/threonine-protein kinase